MIPHDGLPLGDQCHVTARTACHWLARSKESCGIPRRLKLCPGNLCESGGFLTAATGYQRVGGGYRGERRRCKVDDGVQEMKGGHRV